MRRSWSPEQLRDQLAMAGFDSALTFLQYMVQSARCDRSLLMLVPTVLDISETYSKTLASSSSCECVWTAVSLRSLYLLRPSQRGGEGTVPAAGRDEACRSAGQPATVRTACSAVIGGCCACIAGRMADAQSTPFDSLALPPCSPQPTFKHDQPQPHSPHTPHPVCRRWAVR